MYTNYPELLYVRITQSSVILQMVCVILRYIHLFIAKHLVS